jgi:hypothetical protein
VIQFKSGNSKKRGAYIMSIIKEEARKIIDNMPEQATWDDIMYQFYVKKKIMVSLKAAEDGNIISHEDVKKRLLVK